MQPEILHRCDSCGAAIREPAMFCPECGKPLAPSDNAAQLQSTHARESMPATEPDESAAAVDAATTINTAEANQAANEEGEPAQKSERQTARDRTRQTLHRASTAARGAIGDNVKRVEKVRQVSTVVLEEAHADPSLRFVLVALGLFVVFIILLVLSKVMG